MMLPESVDGCRLLVFPQLDGSRRNIRVCTIGWRLLDNPTDPWSVRFMRFKTQSAADVLGGTALFVEAAKEIRRMIPANVKQVGLTCALSSVATSHDPTAPLAKAGKEICRQLDFLWLPDLFSKVAHRSLHNIPGGTDRDSEVYAKYQCESRMPLERLIVIDDFVTRGSTMNEMRRAFLRKNPGVKVVGLALGKNERESYAREHGKEIDNSHIPRKWAQLWDDAGMEI